MGIVHLKISLQILNGEFLVSFFSYVKTMNMMPFIWPFLSIFQPLTKHNG
jgi:hypothetical protein